MRSGRMDRYVTIEEKSENTNDYNDPRDVTWNQITTSPKVMAEKLPMRGSEAPESGKETRRATVRWKIRFREDLDAGMRLVHDSKNYYFVEPPRELGRREGLEIITEQR